MGCNLPGLVRCNLLLKRGAIYYSSLLAENNKGMVAYDLGRFRLSFVIILEMLRKLHYVRKEKAVN